MKSHPAVVHPDDLKPAHASFNHRLAKKLGDSLGAMGFFYFCVLLDLLELPAVWSSGSAIAWVTYISQTVIQLLALPILQVYQNLQSEHNQAKADADHQSLVYIAQIQDEQLEILRLLEDKENK